MYLRLVTYFLFLGVQLGLAPEIHAQDQMIQLQEDHNLQKQIIIDQSLVFSYSEIKGDKIFSSTDISEEFGRILLESNSPAEQKPVVSLDSLLENSRGLRTPEEINRIQLNPNIFELPHTSDPVIKNPLVPLFQNDLSSSVYSHGCTNELLSDHSDGSLLIAFSSNLRKRAKQKRFVSNCFPVLPKDEELIRLSPDGLKLLSQLVGLKQRTVLINRSDGSIPCSGFMIKNDLVLTAAHCLQGELSNDEFSIASNVSEFFVESVDGQKSFVENLERYGSDLSLATTSPVLLSDMKGDVVIARLAEPLIVSEKELNIANFGALDASTPLYIFGRRPLTGPKDGLEQIAVVRDEGCRLLTAPKDDEGALFHQCLTFGGMSGGAIFSITNNQDLVFVGIHQRYAVKDSNDQEHGRCVTPSAWCDVPLRAFRFVNAGQSVQLQNL